MKHTNPASSGPELWFSKILIPWYAASGIIGCRGILIHRIQKETNCAIDVSGQNCYYPGTTDRIICLKGTRQTLFDGLYRVLTALSDLAARSRKKYFSVKLVVPRSAVSMIIGFHGTKVIELQNSTGCRVSVSDRVEALAERLVSISGDFQSVFRGTQAIVEEIQEDCHLLEHVDTEPVVLPLGSWDGGKDDVKDLSCPLLDPATIRGMHDELDPSAHITLNKRDLIKYLKKAAPKQVILNRSLNGKIENARKNHTLETLMEAVQETWDLRRQRPSAVQNSSSESGIKDNLPSFKAESYLCFGAELSLCLDDESSLEAKPSNNDEKLSVEPQFKQVSLSRTGMPLTPENPPAVWETAWRFCEVLGSCFVNDRIKSVQS